MRRKSLIVLIVAVLLLTACGGDTMKGYVFRSLALENIRVEVKTKGGYDMDHKHYDFFITKDKKTVAQGELGVYEDWEAAQKTVSSGQVEVIENKDDHVIWKADGKIMAVYLPTILTTVKITGTISDSVSESDIKGALERFHCEETTDDPSEYIEF